MVLSTPLRHGDGSCTRLQVMPGTPATGRIPEPGPERRDSRATFTRRQRSGPLRCRHASEKTLDLRLIRGERGDERIQLRDERAGQPRLRPDDRRGHCDLGGRNCSHSACRRSALTRWSRANRSQVRDERRRATSGVGYTWRNARATCVVRSDHIVSASG